MAHKANTTRVKGSADFAKTNEALMNEGYAPYVKPDHYLHQSGNDLDNYSDYIHRQLVSGIRDLDNPDGSQERKGLPLLMMSSGTEMQTAKGIGSDNLGFISWGAGNRVPNVTALLTAMLPYTAAGHKFNTDLLAGMGPEPLYHSVRYQLGGGLIREDIPYADAGVFIKGLMHDLRLQRLRLTASSGAEVALAFNDGEGGNVEGQTSLTDDDPVIQDIDEQLKSLQADYDKWEHDQPEIDAFCKATGNNLTFIALASDEQLLGMAFPELDLNQISTEKDEDGSIRATPTWQPKVQAIRYRPAHTCRLERMDKDGRINYVYVSNRFYDDPTAVKDYSNYEIAAYPALSPQTPVADLERIVREARQKRVAVKKRPTRVILPCGYPTPGRPYYPVPAWHSIFTGDIYEYAATIITDRYTRKKNANVIGRVIYIHNDYLNALYTQQTTYAQQAKAQGKKQVQIKSKEQLRDEMYADINNWLNRRTNAGQSLVAFTFTGTDGKDHDSFRVVEIEGSTKNNADANQTELLEISSIIFFAMGLDSTLVGNTPGKTGTNSGTDLRTRYLLKQIQMAPTQQLILRPWYVAKEFNHWDSHLVWRVSREVITTLDNSKTGITQAESGTGATNNQPSAE